MNQSGGGGAVGSVVSSSRHLVDLQACCYDTDAQDLASLLLIVVTELPSESHGVQGVGVGHSLGSE